MLCRKTISSLFKQIIPKIHREKRVLFIPSTWSYVVEFLLHACIEPIININGRTSFWSDKQATYLVKEIYYYLWANARLCAPPMVSSMKEKKRKKKKKRELMEKKKIASRTISGNRMETTHQTRARRRKWFPNKNSLTFND